MQIRIEDFPDIIDIIDAILSNKGIAEVKVEKDRLVVVEIKRTLRGEVDVYHAIGRVKRTS